MRSAFSKFLTASFAAIATTFAGEPVDIAALGTASQTHDHGSGLYPPGNAIDGDLATFNHTDSGGVGAAWELRFPSEQEILPSRYHHARLLRGQTQRRDPPAVRQ